MKDVDFDINQVVIEDSGLAIPFRNLSQAEAALKMKAIKPATFIEQNGTSHQILGFDHRSIGFSGFMNCVTHSLTLTDLGLFEVGRYPAISLSVQNRFWQWFLQRRLANKSDVDTWQKEQNISTTDLMEQVYHALIANP